jgi:hypothetical protein
LVEVLLKLEVEDDSTNLAARTLDFSGDFLVEPVETVSMDRRRFVGHCCDSTRSVRQILWAPLQLLIGGVNLYG